MNRYILIAFAFMGWAFWELSGGADYAPRSVSEPIFAEAPEVTPRPAEDAFSAESLQANLSLRATVADAATAADTPPSLGLQEVPDLADAPDTDLAGVGDVDAEGRLNITFPSRNIEGLGLGGLSASGEEADALTGSLTSNDAPSETTLVPESLILEALSGNATDDIGFGVATPAPENTTQQASNTAAVPRGGLTGQPLTLDQPVTFETAPSPGSTITVTALPDAPAAPIDETISAPLSAIDLFAEPPVEETAPPEETLTSAPQDTPASDVDLRQIIGDRVNLRTGPGTNFSVAGQLLEGDAVEVIGPPEGEWLRLRVVTTGQEGYMADWLVSEKDG